MLTPWGDALHSGVQVPGPTYAAQGPQELRGVDSGGGALHSGVQAAGQPHRGPARLKLQL